MTLQFGVCNVEVFDNTVTRIIGFASTAIKIMALWCKINDSWCISMHYSIFCLRAYLLLIFSLFILSFSYSCCHCVRLLTRCLSMLRRHFCVCICACAVRLVNRHAADDNINYLITRSLTPQRALYEHIITALTSPDTNAWMWLLPLHVLATSTTTVVVDGWSRATFDAA